MSRCVSLVACLLIAITAAVAQPPPPEQPARLAPLTEPLRLTPIAAARLALERSPDLAISQERIRLARGILLEARSISQLRLDADLSYTRMGPGASFELPPEFGGGAIDFAPTSQHRESLQVTVPLWLGGRGKYARQVARFDLAASEHDVNSTLIQVALAAGLTTYRILRLEQLVVVAEQRATAIAEHLRITRAMFDAGTVPRFEVVQAETELARAKGDIIHARTAVGLEQTTLLQTLAVPQTTELDVEEGIPIPVPEGDKGALIARALETRPEVIAARERIRARDANIRLAKANKMPSVAVVGRVNNQTATAAAEAVTWDVTVALKVPILQGSETRGKVTQAQANANIARLTLERTEHEIASQVAQAQLAVRDAQESLAVAEEGEREARERLTIAQVRFANGVSLGVEVLDAQVALAAAQTDAVNARYDLQLATLALWGALGSADFLKGA